MQGDGVCVSLRCRKRNGRAEFECRGMVFVFRFVVGNGMDKPSSKGVCASLFSNVLGKDMDPSPLFSVMDKL